MSKIKPLIRNTILQIGMALGLPGWLAGHRAGKLIILCYHGVWGKGASSEESLRRGSPSVDVFEKQLLWLKQQDYQFVTLTEAVTRWERNLSLPDKAVSLTFDDGFENVIHNAYPIMEKLGVRGCIYVIAGLPGTGQWEWTNLVNLALWARKGTAFSLLPNQSYVLDSEQAISRATEQVIQYLRRIPNSERLSYISVFTDILQESIDRPSWMNECKIATWNDLSMLNPEIMEVGSHTLTHPNLNRVAKADIDVELTGSKRIIEEQICRPVKHLCYPCGVFTPTVQENARKAGYLTAVSTLPGINDAKSNRFALRRYMIYPDMTLFKGQVTGSYRFLFGVR
jgi:peptidoglycan/xylan/chitin deacetylase (PgdA/CDA1 family)